MAAAGIKPESQVSGIMISEKTKPASTRICCLKTEIFSSSLAHRPHVSSENGHRKLSPEWRFLETPAYRFRVDRQNGGFLNMVMSYIKQRIPSVRPQSYSHCFGVFVLTGENDSNTLTCGQAFCRKRRQKFSFFKNF